MTVVTNRTTFRLDAALEAEADHLVRLAVVNPEQVASDGHDVATRSQSRAAQGVRRARSQLRDLTALPSRSAPSRCRDAPTGVVEVRPPASGDRDELPGTRDVEPIDVTVLVGFLPHRKSWTRRAPGLQHLCVRARARPEPLEQVKDEGVDGARHAAAEHITQVKVVRTSHRTYRRARSRTSQDRAPSTDRACCRRSPSGQVPDSTTAVARPTGPGSSRLAGSDHAQPGVVL